MLGGVANAVLLFAAVLLPWYVVSYIRRHRRGIVAERGMSIGADLGALSDQARVRVDSVTSIGPDRIRVVLVPAPRPDDGAPRAPEDLDLVVLMAPDDFGLQLLRDWMHSQVTLAIVVPPGSRLVRLRSIEDLQPLTLRREG